MTPSEIHSIASKHVEAWLTTPGELATSVTLRRHVANAITEALAENNRSGETGSDAQLDAIKAALSFDPSKDRDLETCARRIYHERTDFKFAAEQWQKKAETMRDKMQETIEFITRP